jgi:hypothetical protein
MSAFLAADTVTTLPSEPRLIGTWHLVSFEMQNSTSEPSHPLGQHPQGQIIYDDVGNMSCHLLNPDPPTRPTDATDGADYEARISYTRYASYYGPYEVDVVTRTVHHHVVGALMPGWAGTTVDRDYAFDGDDELTLSAKIEAVDQLAVLKWRRAK